MSIASLALLRFKGSVFRVQRLDWVASLSSVFEPHNAEPETLNAKRRTLNPATKTDNNRY